MQMPRGQVRFFALDALRGLDMLFLFVIQPLIMTIARGWGFADARAHPWIGQLEHHWGGFTAYDLIMPLFIFVCGAAIPFAVPKRLDEGGRPTLPFWKHVLSRVVLLWILGMAAQGRLRTFDPSRFVYFSNTLQAIAVGYLIAALIFLVKSVRVRVAVLVGLVATYGIALQVFGDYSVSGNLAMKIDMAFVRVLQPCGHDTGQYTWYFTSLMFGVMSLLGMEVSLVLKSARAPWCKAGILVCLGVGLWGAGLLLELLGVPCIKQIFTVSFTAQAMGASVLLLAFLYVVTDIWRFRRGWWLVTLYGQVALASYVIGGILRPIPTAAAQAVLGDLPKRLGAPWDGVLLMLGYSAALTFFLYVWRAFSSHRRAERCRGAER